MVNQEMKTLYEESIQKTTEHVRGNSCFDYKCKGKMGEPRREGILLQCDVCDQGLKSTTYEKWLLGRVRGLCYSIETETESIKYAKMDIEDLKKQIQTKKDGIKASKIKLREDKKKLSKVRKARREL